MTNKKQCRKSAKIQNNLRTSIKTEKRETHRETDQKQFRKTYTYEHLRKTTATWTKLREINEHLRNPWMPWTISNFCRGASSSDVFWTVRPIYWSVSGQLLASLLDRKIFLNPFQHSRQGWSHRHRTRERCSPSWGMPIWGLHLGKTFPSKKQVDTKWSKKKLRKPQEILKFESFRKLFYILAPESL